MDLSDFLDRVDTVLRGCTENQLKRFIRQQAGLVPEEGRETFLNQLQLMADSADEKAAVSKLAPTHGEDCARLIKVLEAIENGDLTLSAKYSLIPDIMDMDIMEEHYDYSDPEGIVPVLEIACILVHLWVKQKDYENACALGRKLAMLCIWASDVDEDEDEEKMDMNIWDVKDGMRLQLDLKTLTLDTMLAAYFASETRCEDIYNLALNEEKLTLKDLRAYAGDGLPDFPKFLKEWLPYLGGKEDSKAESLYTEALGMLPDDKARISCVLQYAEHHPEGFEYCLLSSSSIPVEQRWALSLEGLRTVDRKLRIRSKIALEAANLAIRLEKPQQELEALWLEAFLSDTTAMNCLRLLLHSSEPVECRQKLAAVVDAHRDDHANFRGDGCRQNEKSDNDICILQILLGRGMDVLRHGILPREFKEYDSFDVNACFLYLAALHQGTPESGTMQTVFNRVKRVLQFERDLYFSGIPREVVQDLLSAQGLPNQCDLKELPEDTLFRCCFCQWRDRTISLKNSDIEEILSGLQNIVSCNLNSTESWRLAGVRLTDYACILAAVGEVRESYGQKGAKQKLLSHYAKLYSQNTKFLSELLRYGWNGK